MTEANIRFERPISLADVLAMCRRLAVRPTQLISRMRLGGESMTRGVMVDSGMGEEAISKRFREAGAPANVLVNEMYATGDAGDLQGLNQEPGVRRVFLKPPNASLNR
jgi:hypothetical protein